MTHPGLKRVPGQELFAISLVYKDRVFGAEVVDMAGVYTCYCCHPAERPWRFWRW